MIASALRQIYHSSIDGQSILITDEGSVSVPAIYFRNQQNILLREDNLSVEFAMSNVPCKLVEDRRVRIGLWICLLYHSECTKNNEFVKLFSTSIDARKNSYDCQMALFKSGVHNISMPFEGFVQIAFGNGHS